MTNQLLDQCLQQMASGVSLEACLAAHPDQRMELEPLLRTAALLRSAQQLTAPTAFKQATRTRLLNQIESQQMQAPAPVLAPERSSSWWENLISTLKRPLAMPSMAAAIIVALILVLGVFTTTSAAQSALPGDALYTVKLWEESLQVRFSDDPIQLRLEFAERRLQESLALQNQQRYEAVPDTLTRYQQQLDYWMPLAEARGVVQQEQIQQRLRRQVQLLDALEQAAPVQQQTMLRETHQRVERLIHKPGSGPAHGTPPFVMPSVTPETHAPVMAPRHGTVTPGVHMPSPTGSRTPDRSDRPMQPTLTPANTHAQTPHPMATPHMQGDDQQHATPPSTSPPGHRRANTPGPTPSDDPPPATPTPAETEAPPPTDTPPHGDASPTAWPDDQGTPQHTPTMEHDGHGTSQPPHTPQPTQESGDPKGKRR